MPIEISAHAKGSSLGYRQSVEPGSIHFFRYLEKDVGRVLLIGCNDQDHGGYIAAMTEEVFVELTDENGRMSQELEQHIADIVPAGGSRTVSLHLEPNSTEVTFFLQHNSPN